MAFCKYSKCFYAMLTLPFCNTSLAFDQRVRKGRRFFNEKGSFVGDNLLHQWFFLNLLGGWDVWLASLMSLMATDIIVGIIKSLLCRSDKSESGALNAASMFRGGVKKILILVVIALATLLDEVIIPGSTNIRSVTAGYYIANEALSVIENIGACGVPLPKVFFRVVDSLKKDEYG